MTMMKYVTISYTCYNIYIIEEWVYMDDEVERAILGGWRRLEASLVGGDNNTVLRKKDTISFRNVIEIDAM